MWISRTTIHHIFPASLTHWHHTVGYKTKEKPSSQEALFVFAEMTLLFCCLEIVFLCLFSSELSRWELRCHWYKTAGLPGE